MRKIIMSTLFLGVALGGFAQKKGKKTKNGLEAKIVFEIVYEQLPEMLEPYANMLPKEMVTYVKGGKSRIEQSTMGMNTITVTDSDKKTGFMLMDQFGTKTAYTMSEKDFEKQSQEGANDFEVTYTTETKEIAGYKCTKVELKSKKDATTSYAWVTEEIQGTSKNYSFLKGYPLEYQVHAPNDIVILMKVKTLEKTKVADDFFEIPKGYEVKTMEEFQKEMQKMMGGGEGDE